MKIGIALVCTGIILFTLATVYGSFLTSGFALWFVALPCLYFGAKRMKQAKRRAKI